MESWKKFLPSAEDAREDALRKREHEVSLFILQRGGFSTTIANEIRAESETNLLTFFGLSRHTNFPLRLRPAVFKAAQIKILGRDLEVRPEKTPLFKAFDAFDEEDEDGGHSLGIVFKWTYHGKFHILHNAKYLLEGASGLQGHWWLRKDEQQLFLQPLDVFLDILGHPENW